MEYSQFKSFPDDARVWVYGFERDLDDQDKKDLQDGLNRFMGEWNSHGNPVTGGFEIVNDRFLLVSGYMPGGISGCSIDGSVNQVRSIGEKMGLSRSSGDTIYYRDSDGIIQTATRAEFQQMATDGEIASETPVFDLTISTVADLKNKGIENPFRSSWHSRVFDLVEANV
jgi:hypothetical protein